MYKKIILFTFLLIAITCCGKKSEPIYNENQVFINKNKTLTELYKIKYNNEIFKI